MPNIIEPTPEALAKSEAKRAAHFAALQARAFAAKAALKAARVRLRGDDHHKPLR